MASAVKKPPATNGRETPTSTPQRPAPKSTSTPTSSSNSPAGAGAGSGSNATRIRPARAATPVSARAAAHQRRESLLNGSRVNGSGANSPDMEREEAIRAETMAIIDDLKERLAQAEASAESYKRQVDVLQSKLDDALKEQSRLEEKVHESEEQIEALTNEKRDAARQIREMETIYEAERSAMLKEKEEMVNREEEMQAVIQRLKDTLAQRNNNNNSNNNNNDEDRPSRQAATSPTADSFAPPSSIHRSDSRNNSKLLLQKDKLIESLRLELAEAQIKLVEAQNQDGGRLQEVERQLMEARIANARLMEDNESYQLLLQKRTLRGDFSSDFGGASANQDALAALEGRSSQGGTSLADELSDAHDNEHDLETQRRLEAELRQVKDQNKALTLYINKIIERLLQHQGFEHILDQSNDTKPPANTNKDLPPPPNSKQQSSGTSLLQRAKTALTGGGSSNSNNANQTATTTSAATTTAQPKQRPQTYMPTSASSVISNPETAPSIPIGLGRTTSLRRGRPMSEQYPGAANIVNAMYRGPSAADGPLSPSLRTSQTFFLPQGAGNRSSTGSGANFPGGVRSSASSIASGDSNNGTADGVSTAPTTSSQASPPRSHHHTEKNTTFAGNKPRPLRLVQENAEAQAAANKRQSWVGWAASAFGGRSVSGSAPRDGEV